MYSTTICISMYKYKLMKSLYCKLALGARELLQVMYDSEAASFSAALCRELRLVSIIRGVDVLCKNVREWLLTPDADSDTYNAVPFERCDNIGSQKIDRVFEVRFSFAFVDERGDKIIELQW